MLDPIVHLKRGGHWGLSWCGLRDRTQLKYERSALEGIATCLKCLREAKINLKSPATTAALCKLRLDDIAPTSQGGSRG